MLRWNAQHGSLSRPSARAFHPAIVSGVLFRGTSSGGSGMSSRGRSGRPSGRSCGRPGSPLAGEQSAREDLHSLRVGVLIPVSRCSAPWSVMPQSSTASYWASRTARLLAVSRPSARCRNRPRNSTPFAWLVSVWAKKM